MATNASWQNFSELLLGGLQRGLSATRQQQGQKADLLLTLQDMLRRKQEADRAYALQKEEFEAQKAAASIARTRQGNVDIYNAFRDMREESLKKRQLESMENMRKAQEMWYRAQSTGGTTGAQVNRRMVISTLLKNELGNEDNYTRIKEKDFKKMKDMERAGFERVYDVKYDDYFYQKMKPEARARITMYQKALEKMAGLEQLPEGVYGPPVPELSEQDILEGLESFLKEE